MTATRWWSASKKQFVVLEEMHDAHLLNAAKKFERGEYLVPSDPDDSLAVSPPSLGEQGHLARTFDSEMKRRAIGKYAAPEPPDEQEGA
jgi:hypothetical protein